MASTPKNCLPQKPTWHCVVPTSWAEFKRRTAVLASDNSNSTRWLFRGECDAARELCSSFERTCVLDKIEASERGRVESMMIREFKRRFHNYAPTAPADDAMDEWLALMQHYGAPTRLVDFTYSPLIAAYFAFARVDSRGTDCASIWAVNIDNLTKKIGDNPRVQLEYSLYQDHQTSESFSRVFMFTEPNDLVLSLSPYRLNERQSAQRGAFLCQGNISTSLVENLKEFLKDPEHLKESVIQFTIRKNQKRKVIDDLDNMNINGITLFPDLVGFAESFGPRMTYFERLANRRKSSRVRGGR